ncbi:Hypothetical predicted protein [Marmota monax]|uniref:Uncharacterized protein n=1 Tax=Marmota monax TaxID=9995 RepID=A0A5E4C9L3_MARMO|nr:Hypothetical predicted protein [Marmota monax]
MKPGWRSKGRGWDLSQAVASAPGGLRASLSLGHFLLLWEPHAAPWAAAVLVLSSILPWPSTAHTAVHTDGVYSSCPSRGADHPYGDPQRQPQDMKGVISPKQGLPLDKAIWRQESG